MLTKAITAHIKNLRKYMGFYDTYSKAFSDFLSALEAFYNARMTHQIIDPVTLERQKGNSI